MKQFSLLIVFFSLAFLGFSQTQQQLITAAQQFPPMPRGTADMIPFVQGLPTFTSGAPFNDLDFTLLDTDYMDGENSGGDVFMPVDPSDAFPGADNVKYIRCVLNTDLNLGYGSADADRIILGTHEIAVPFFSKGPDGIDNDYAVIQHLDYAAGYIQLKGAPADYSLIYATTADIVQTEGYYLFYTANFATTNDIDLIAFIFACDDIAFPVSGNPPNNLNPLCNSSQTLNLTNPTHFKYAQPISTTIAIPNAIGQYGSNGKEILGGMTTDGNNNTYLFGCTDGNLDNNTDAPNEIFVAKLDSNGIEQWVTELAMSEGTILKGGVTDDQFVYVAGRTLGSLPGFTNAGRWDGIILKLDINSGQIVATDQWGNAGIDGYGNIILDDTGNLFVSAQGSPVGMGGVDDVYLVAKHRTSNLSNVWRELRAPNSNAFVASAEAWGGLTYVPGTTPGDGRLIAAGWYFSNMGANAFVSVYENLNATTPTRPHSVIIDAPGTSADWVLDNAVDSAGNIYVAGFTTGNLGTAPLGEGDAYVIKYSPQLTNPIYRQFGTNKSDQIRKMEIVNDTIYTVGYTYGNLIGANADSNLLTGDVFVQKLDTSLNLLNGTQFGTPHEDRGFAEMRNNNLFIGGMTEGAMAGANNGSFDGYALAMDPLTLTVQSPTLSTTSFTMQNSFTLYPNPVINELFVNSAEVYDGVSAFAKAYTYKIYDLQGRLIRSEKNLEENVAIDVSQLTQGTYLLQLQADLSLQTMKFIKK